jgi:hypothetical protein
MFMSMSAHSEDKFILGLHDLPVYISVEDLNNCLLQLVKEVSL